MIWDVEKKKCIQKYECFEDPISKTLFHPHEQCVTTATKSKNITIHDLRTEKIVQHYDAHHDSVNDIAIHPTKNFMVSVSSSSEIKVIFILFRSGI